MGGNQHLVFLAPQCLCQLQPDLVGHFRGGLAGGKALVAVVGYGAFLLAEPLFDGNHLIAGGGGAAIHPGHKPLHDGHILIVHRNLSRFLLLDGIFDYIGEALGLLAVHALFLVGGGVFGLIRVFDIDENLAQPAVHPPDGCGSHCFTPWALAKSPPW